MTITAVDNDLWEGESKSVLVTGTVTGNTGIAAPSQRELTILEDDARTALYLKATPANIDENGGVSTITAVSTVPVPITVTLDVRVFGSYVTLSDDTQLTIVEGQTTSTGTVTVTAGDIAGTNSPSSTISFQNLSSTTFSVRTTSVIVLDDDNTGTQLWMLLSPSSMVEGDQFSTVTAFLTRAVAEPVTVTIAIDPDNTTAYPDEYTLSGNLTLTIPTGQTASTGTVTLTLMDNDYYGARFAARVGYTYEVTAGPAGLHAAKVQDAWSIREDELPPEVTLVLTPDAIGENGGESTVTATLNSAVRSNITVTVSAEASGDFTQTGHTLTIAEGSKTSTGSVKFTAINNDVDALDKQILVSGSLDIAEELPFGTILFPYSRHLAITDDDEAELILSTASLTVGEGSNATYRVKLATEPTSNVSVSIGLPPDTDISVDKPGLTFTTTDWNIEQTVTVSAAHDDDAVDDDATLTHTASGADYGSVRKDLPVTVTDDDEADLVISPPSPTVNEGGVKRKLHGDAGHAAFIECDRDHQRGWEADLTLGTTTLSFTNANWNTPQTVTVSAGQDDDAVNDRGTLAHTASGGGYDSVSRNLAVAVTDDDTGREQAGAEVSVSFERASYAAEEGGSPARVTVRVMLNADPEREITVPLSVGLNGGATDEDYEGVPGQISFGPGELEKTFDITATDDNLDDDDESLTLGFGTLPERVIEGSPASARISIQDNDDPMAAVSFDQSNYETEEGGSPTLVTVFLSVDPEREVTIPLTVSFGNGATMADYSGGPSSLSFKSGETEKNFALTAVDDRVDDDDESVTLGFGTLTHRVDAGRQLNASVRIIDNDERGVTVSAAALTVPEGGAGSYTVVLHSAPTSPVTIEITVQENTEVSVDAAQLSFSAENWDAPQEVVVRALDDDDAVVDRVTLDHAITGGDYGEVTAPSVAVTVVEDDVPVVTIENERATEHAGEMVFTVLLDIESSEKVSAEYATANGTAAAGMDYTATKGVVRFVPLQTRMTVSVPIIDDSVEEDSETFTLRLAEPLNAILDGNGHVATGTIDDNAAAIRALEIFLSSVGRMVASDAVEVISRRFDPRIGGRPMLTLGGRSLILNQNESIGRLAYAINPAQDITSAAGPGHRVPPDPRTALLLSHLRHATVWDVLSSSDFRVPLKAPATHPDGPCGPRRHERVRRCAGIYPADGCGCLQQLRRHRLQRSGKGATGSGSDT